MLAKGTIIAILYWALLLFPPIWLLRSRYIETANVVDPAGVAYVGVTLGNLILATLPWLVLWFWLPKASADLEESLRKVSNGELKPLVLSAGWHAPASIIGATILIAPFLSGLSSDPIVEWWGTAWMVGVRLSVRGNECPNGHRAVSDLPRVQIRSVVHKAGRERANDTNAAS